MWLHVVGLGRDGLSKDPLRGFARLLESGRENLEWQLMEHESSSAFLAWLSKAQRPRVFGSFRSNEVNEVPLRRENNTFLSQELRRTAAAAGGANW